eukprot:658640-Rhodomonas_salina.1
MFADIDLEARAKQHGHLHVGQFHPKTFVGVPAKHGEVPRNLSDLQSLIAADLSCFCHLPDGAVEL